MTITHLTPSKLSSRIKPPNSFLNLSRGNKWSSRLGWTTVGAESAPEMVAGHTFIPVRLDFASSDPAQVKLFEEGKTAAIALNGSAKCKGGVGLWSPAAEALMQMTGVPGMHLIIEGVETPRTLRIRADKGKWVDGSIVAYVGVMD